MSVYRNEIDKHEKLVRDGKYFKAYRWAYNPASGSYLYLNNPTSSGKTMVITSVKVSSTTNDGSGYIRYELHLGPANNTTGATAATFYDSNGGTDSDITVVGYGGTNPTRTKVHDQLFQLSETHELIDFPIRLPENKAMYLECYDVVSAPHVVVTITWYEE